MKKLQFMKLPLIGLVCAVAMVLLGTTYGAEKTGGGDAKLIITRSPRLGSGTSIAVLVDGKKVGTVQSGNRYNGTMAAGRHTVSVRFEPLSTADKPADIQVDVAAGQTYSYSATIKSGAIALQKNR
ncbi:MAG: hypothetical protein ACJ8M1_04255 [Chthoniobacterales bacterium]